jgi:hypothetical protein
MRRNILEAYGRGNEHGRERKPPPFLKFSPEWINAIRKP